MRFRGRRHDEVRRERALRVERGIVRLSAFRASMISIGRTACGGQANPDGMSGRIVRGYKRWRHKR